jgi:hypothetical protein
MRTALLGLAITVLARATIVSSSQSSSTQPWGVNEDSVYGQTLNAPVDLYLDSFTFFLGPPASGTVNIQYEADVYAWNTTTNEASGSALYVSPLQSYTSSSTQLTYTPVTFFPEVSVTSGDEYVLFITTAGLQGGQAASAISVGSGTEYTEGTFVFQQAGNTVEPNINWIVNRASVDLAFSADFEDFQNPEPSTVGLLGMGLAGLG